MHAALLGLALLLQAPPPPTVSVTADRARLGVGEVVVVTITAQSSDPRPVTITVNPPDGLAVIERLESSDAAVVDAGATVTATLTLRMRAMEPGRWPVGPVRAIVGGAITDVDGVVVDVGDPPEISVLVSNPRLRALLARAPPPRRRGDVVLRLLTSRDTVRTGAQVDVVAAAWFPRGLRLQLRRPPVLQPPVIGGVWSRVQGAGSGLVTSRRVADEWYDLFVAHQIIFPLAPGRVTVPRAMLRFDTPAAPDSRTELYDGPRTLVALPLPSGAPASFAGAVGSGLRVTRRVDGEPRAGEGLTLEVTVAGRGNAALWPAPELIWPAGVRAYPDGASESVDVIEGRLGGSKSFRFAVVPSRAGALALPRVVYPYFDPDAEAYREARLDAGTVAVRPADPRQLRGPRLTLLAPERIALTRRVARRIPSWGWVLLVLLPVTLPWLRRRRAPSVPPRQRVPADLRFTRMLIELAGNGDDRALAATLRARGMIAADAAAALRTRDALAEAAYGPSAGGVSPSLAQEAERLADALEALQPPPRTWVDRAGRAGLGLVALVAVGSLAALQSDGAEAAFARGEFTTAAAKFAARAARTPDAAAAWYNLGASSLGAGDETAAIGAFVRAARRDPRSPDIRAALQLSPTTDRAARDARAVLPITPDEAASIGLLCWWLGWIVVRLGWRRRRSAAVAASLLLGLGGAALSAAAWLRWRESRPMALVRQATVLRRSPHERGERLGDLQLGAAVAVVQRRAGWCLVRGPVGEGWVVTAQLVALAE